MVKVYRELIKKKQMTIDRVPASLKDKVLEALKEIGLDENGDPV